MTDDNRREQLRKAQKAYREKRKVAGDKLLQVWLNPEAQAVLDGMKQTERDSYINKAVKLAGNTLDYDAGGRST